MKGSELLRKIRRLGKARNCDVSWDADLGKGSHGVLRVNGKFSVIPNLKKELKPGTLHAILKQLEIPKDDL